MERVLITGAGGFIGQHLLRELSYTGHIVGGVDWADGDLREPGVFQRHLDEKKPDTVVHLAAQVGRLFGEDDLCHTITENALMTTLIANACGHAGVRLVYTSTSEIYGDMGEEWAREDFFDPSGLNPHPYFNATLPHNLYGLTKRWGEEVSQLYAPEGLICLRLSMPYGPGVVPGRGRAALPNMLWQAATGQDIIVHRGAERSWCWVGDTARAIRMIMDSGESGAFNVGRNEPRVRMEDIARQCCVMALASKDLIKIVDPPGPQTLVKRLDCTRLHNLGWEPEVDLDVGMVEVWNWVRQFDRDSSFIYS